MKLFIDDIRDSPEGWVLARSISEAINLITVYQPEITHISFDHDISFSVQLDKVMRPFPSLDTFDVVAKFYGAMWKINPVDVELTVHSSNPVGRERIISSLAAFGLGCADTPYETATRRAL